jgi:ribosomal protein L2
MYGKAKLEIPKMGDIGPSATEGLSDALAMSFGRIAARMLSEEEGFVIVTLESGAMRVIGNDTLENQLVIGHVRSSSNA